MSGRGGTMGQQLLRGAPYFPVTDLDRAMRYYEDVLGFSVDYAGGEPPQFAIMSRDDLPIMLRLISASHVVRPNESQGGTWDVFYWVRDVEALAAELSATGAEVAYGLVERPEYHMKEFAVRDPDGHVLGFGESLDA